jgi:type IV pilus assembly protein PilV
VAEVFMAMSVLTIGVAGVAAIQKAIGVSNSNARNLAAANMVGQSILERMRVDALSWNEQGGVADISQTLWLKNATTSAPTAGGGWSSPTPAVNAFTLSQPAGAWTQDSMGADIYGTGDTFAPAYCSQVRLTRLPNNFTRNIRVEVRVVWDRRNQTIDCTNLPTGWDSGDFMGRYGSVYLVSAITMNAAPF